MQRYQLIRTSTGEVFAESDNYEKLEAKLEKYEKKRFICKIVKTKDKSFAELKHAYPDFFGKQ